MAGCGRRQRNGREEVTANSAEEDEDRKWINTAKKKMKTWAVKAQKEEEDSDEDRECNPDNEENEMKSGCGQKRKKTGSG